MADSDENSQGRRESWYDQQRSSLRSDRSIRTPPSRSHSSHALQDFTLREGENRDEDGGHGHADELSAPPSPPPVIPRRRASLEKTKSKSSSGSQSRLGSSRRPTRDGRTGSRGRNIDEYLTSGDCEGLTEVAGAAVERRRSARDAAPHDALEEEEAYGGLSEVAGAAVVDRRESRTRPPDETLEEEEEEGVSRRPPRRSYASSLISPGGRFVKRLSSPFTSRSRGRDTPASALDITALPHYQDEAAEPVHKDSSDEYLASKTPTMQRASRFATQLYIISYLIFFSILGTLARLGLQWLTFYPGAPSSFSVLWANFTGSLVMGFLVEDQRLFRQEWGRAPPVPSSPEEIKQTKAAHGKTKKTLPPYIGLATGFCGSFTSFSSFMRDTFFALSNNLPSPNNHPTPGISAPSTSSTVARNGGYSVMAVLAVILITIALSYSALKIGIHSAAYLDYYTPTVPFRLCRRFFDPLIVIIAFGSWLGAVFLSVWPPDRPGGPNSHGLWANETWRGQAIFACVFAPLGCLLRFYVSLHFNPLIPSFPLGTFAVNIFGTAVLGMCYDLQHVSIGAHGVGGGRVACQVLQGLMDGFCGCLTTVSTWIVELDTLRRGHAYVYGGVSVSVGLGVMVAVMGSVRWSVGWSEPVCITSW